MYIVKNNLSSLNETYYSIIFIIKKHFYDIQNYIKHKLTYQNFVIFYIIYHYSQFSNSLFVHNLVFVTVQMATVCNAIKMLLSFEDDQTSSHNIIINNNYNLLFDIKKSL